jgi:hypothetical protein
VGLFSAHEIEASEITEKYGSILLPEEEVLAAFRSIRDTVFLTNLRFVMVDVQGLTGSKVEIQSVPYRSIVRFSVETAGTLDLDSDLKIWVSSAAAPLTAKISRKADPQAIQRILALQLLARK